MINLQHRSQTDPPLACLNCTVQVSALKGFACNPILRQLGEAIRQETKARNIQICDLLLTLNADVDVEGVATARLSVDQPDLEVGPELDEPVERGHLSIKIRALGKPDPLHAAVTQALNHTWTIFPNLFARLAEMEHFAAPKAAAGAS